MSLFKGLLFIEESRRVVLELGKGAFGPTFGNRVANEEALREPWEHGGPASPPVDGEVLCSGGCG